mgnify:CR=1 FL=1
MLVELYTQTPWKCMTQQEEKTPYFRHKAEGLVILIQGFITTKRVAYPLALRELR